MDYPLTAIIDSSRILLSDMNLSYSVRRLASVVVHGAALVDHHQLHQSFPLPQFERALFHLCHAVDRPLCGQCVCHAMDADEAHKCFAVGRPH